MIVKLPADRTPYEQQIASFAERQFDTHPEKLAQWLDESTEAERQQLQGLLAELEQLKPEPLPTQAFVVADVGPVAPARLAARWCTAGRSRAGRAHDSFSAATRHSTTARGAHSPLAATLGPLDYRSRQSVDRAGHCQSHLGATFWHGAGRQCQ